MYDNILKNFILIIFEIEQHKLYHFTNLSKLKERYRNSIKSSSYGNACKHVFSIGINDIKGLILYVKDKLLIIERKMEEKKFYFLIYVIH